MEHFDVLIVGAGLSGIGAACHLQRSCPWATFAVLEARQRLGGTWDLFRYPGVRSDSDMFTLGYSFRPWRGPKAIAEGADILRYLQDTAADAGLERHLRLGHRVVRAEWSSQTSTWTVHVQRTDTTAPVRLSCNFYLSCTGYYRYDRGHLPELPGADRFTGTLVHPQAWPPGLDHGGRRVVVVGSGATAVSLVPALARRAAHVTLLQRSPGYLLSMATADPLADLLRRHLPARWAAPVLRWTRTLLTQGMYALSRRRPALVRRVLRRRLAAELPAGFDLDTHFSPAYDPWDQRLCVVADGDLFAAITAGTVSVVTDHVASLAERGVRCRSGRHLDADIVVMATGLELLFLGGAALCVDGRPVDVAERLLYRATMLEGVPNLAVIFGYTNASWTLRCELSAALVCRLLRHRRRHGWQHCTPVHDGDRPRTEPMLSLRAGYVARSVDRLPKQGDRQPWRVRQSYLHDFAALKLGAVVDRHLVLSGGTRPGRRPAGTARPWGRS